MNILRKQKVQIPEKFKDAFSGYQGIKIGIDYQGIDNLANPGEFKSEVKLYLTPGNGPDRKDYLKIHSQPGPEYKYHQHEILVTHAKSLVRNEQFIDEILTQYISSKN